MGIQNEKQNVLRYNNGSCGRWGIEAMPKAVAFSNWLIC
jgi:hypothetical protein